MQQKQTQFDDRAVTEQEAAAVLGVSRITVRRRIDSRELDSFLVGRARRIWLSEIYRFARSARAAELAARPAETAPA